jgi:hypothetical protein
MLSGLMQVTCQYRVLFTLAIIQIIAASQAGRPLIYLTFGEGKLATSLWKVYEYLCQEQATVKDLITYLQNYSNLFDKLTLFEYILQTPVKSLY